MQIKSGGTSVAVAAVTAIAALTLGAMPSAARAAGGDAPNECDRMFAMKVGQGNVAEVESSRLALRKSNSMGVRRVAQMLITQHGQAQTVLLQDGRKAHVRVPDSADPEHKALAKKLMSLSGDAFNKTFLEAQVRDHYKTIALFNKELKEGNNSTIRGFAARFLPDIETHTQHITAQASKFGISTASHIADNPAAKGNASSASLPGSANR